MEWGRTNALIDGIGWVFGIPSKIVLLDSRMDNHHISQDTMGQVSEYLHTNDLLEVKVRVNQYAPAREWSRLFRNRAVGAGWRYTLGVFSMLYYTLLPGRILGGDNYNPYTDTMSLYSNIPAVGMHEGGHAKDFGQREWKGTYAFFYALPLVALYPEAVATGDAVGYLRAERGAADERAAYKILYPAYSTYVGGEFGQFTPVSSVVYLSAVVVGHVAGRCKAAGVADRPDPRAAAGNAPDVRGQAGRPDSAATNAVSRAVQQRVD